MLLPRSLGKRDVPRKWHQQVCMCHYRLLQGNKQPLMVVGTQSQPMQSIGTVDLEESAKVPFQRDGEGIEGRQLSKMLLTNFQG